MKTKQILRTTAIMHSSHRNTINKYKRNKRGRIETKIKLKQKPGRKKKEQNKVATPLLK